MALELRLESVEIRSECRQLRYLVCADSPSTTVRSTADSRCSSRSRSVTRPLAPFVYKLTAAIARRRRLLEPNSRSRRAGRSRACRFTTSAVRGRAADHSHGYDFVFAASRLR
ncbi:hypothetical protein D8S78_03970 [Natrialba swarupiae]|nr:hypothetical protein [Natrialba swarupiae]